MGRLEKNQKDLFKRVHRDDMATPLLTNSFSKIEQRGFFQRGFFRENFRAFFHVFLFLIMSERVFWKTFQAKFHGSEFDLKIFSVNGKSFQKKKTYLEGLNIVLSVQRKQNPVLSKENLS